MSLKRLLPVLTATLFLASCSPSAQDGEYPVYGDGYDLNTKDGMADYLKEYKTLPDDYINHDADQLEGDDQPKALKPTQTLSRRPAKLPARMMNCSTFRRNISEETPTNLGKQ